MLVAERLREIERFIKQEGSARVTELSKTFNVTEETIRRDLTKLEGEGKLYRSHGGAVRVADPENGITFSGSSIRHVEEKKTIAQKAITFLEENDTILLDASTTAWQMAKHLPDIPLTVITPSVKVIIELASKRHVNVISTGGQFFAGYWSFVGPRTEQALSGFHVKKLFMSCSSIDVSYGLSDSNESQAMLKRRMMDISDRRFLLIDHSKFGRKDLAFIGPVDAFSDIIVDDQVDSAALKQMKKMKRSVHLVSAE